MERVRGNRNFGDLLVVIGDERVDEIEQKLALADFYCKICEQTNRPESKKHFFSNGAPSVVDGVTGHG